MNNGDQLPTNSAKWCLKVTGSHSLIHDRFLRWSRDVMLQIENYISLLPQNL